MPPQQGLLAGFATGLLCLKAHVENRLGLEAVILDLSEADIPEARMRLQGIASGITGPAVFGITTTTASYRAALALAHELKRTKRDEAIVIFGGHHATADWSTVLSCHVRVVDFVIAGEGEVPLVEFMKNWPSIGDVPGLCRLVSPGGLRANPPPPPLGQQVLDSLTLDPGWFSETRQPGKFDRYTYVSARGCPLRCRFCSVANTTIRGKSPHVVAEEIRKIVEAGYRRIAIEDNFFAHAPKRTKEICDALTALRSGGLDFNWDCQTRVEAISRPGVACMLKEAGCDEVYLGVEALDAEALEFLGKTPRPDRYFKQFRETAIPELLANGLGININMQCGLPLEAELEVQRSLSRLREVAAIAFSGGSFLQVFPQLFVVYPGTAHFLEFCERGVLWPEVFESFVEWEPRDPDFVEWLGRNFAHGVGGIPLGILDRDSLLDRRFVIDSRLATAAERFRLEMASIPGVSVFDYGSHLVPRSNPRLTANL